MTDRRLTVLNFSAGSQSTAILWMVLRGELETPDNFVVLSADPGMEGRRTREHRAEMFARCAEAGITAAVAPGPNLKSDLLQIRTKKRIDNPPFWTLSPGGSVGRLQHKCTRHYKIAPMDRWIRAWLEREWDIPANRKTLPRGLVIKWIGFAADEGARVKPPRRKYIRFEYPLIRLGMTRADVSKYYADRDLVEPPRSVCNACFANDVAHYRTLEPEDLADAVAIDDVVRDMSSVGVDDEVFVCRSMMSVREMVERGFDLEDEVVEASRCDAGYCFV